ncbi:MAG: pantetheine-phosphate adenylyltransferase [Thermoplasmata archaeon]
MKTVAIAGSFDHLHNGHKFLIKQAFTIGNRVCIGLTSNDYINKYKNQGGIENYDTRLENLKNYCMQFKKEFSVIELNDKYGPSIKNRELTDMVVTTETLGNAKEINRIRKNNGMKQLKLHIFNKITGEDLIPISSTRVRNGIISKEGIRLKPLSIGICTKNKIKIEGTKKALNYYMPKIYKIYTHKPLSQYQPLGLDQTIKAALSRCNGLQEELIISVESGAIYIKESLSYLDIHIAVIKDLTGHVTIGTSRGFLYPSELTQMLSRHTEASEAIKNLYGIKKIGRKEGIIGILSNKKILREELVEEAVKMALLPRAYMKNPMNVI